MKKTLIILSVVFGLSGCGAMQQYQYQQQQQAKIDTAKAKIAELNSRCTGSFKSDPRLDPLRPYMTFDGKESIQQMSSTKKPNAKEKQAILVFDELASECIAERVAILQAADAPYFMIQGTREYGLAAKQSKADLWAGKLTYGQYLKQAHQNYQNAENARVAAAQEYDQRQQQAQMRQAQINAANAQATAAVMSAQAQQQSANAQTMMMFNQAQQQQIQRQQQFNAPGTATNPVQTNCNRIGNSVNCQTYSY